MTKSALPTDYETDLRDRFAVAALGGLLSQQANPIFDDTSPAYFVTRRADLLAQEAFRIADEMMKARRR